MRESEWNTGDTVFTGLNRVTDRTPQAKLPSSAEPQLRRGKPSKARPGCGVGQEIELLDHHHPGELRLIVPYCSVNLLLNLLGWSFGGKDFVLRGAEISLDPVFVDRINHKLVSQLIVSNHELHWFISCAVFL